jgi:hypothetical protein
MRKPRLYYLGNQEISSHRVGGAIHVAKKDFGECVACGEMVKKGQKRVRMFVFGADEPIHLECYVGDHSDPSCILAVGTKKVYRFGIERVEVMCKIFGGEQNNPSLFLR